MVVGNGAVPARQAGAAARPDAVTSTEPGRAGIGHGKCRILRFIWLWFSKRNISKALAELEDRLLRDIGVTLAETGLEANTPFSG